MNGSCTPSSFDVLPAEALRMVAQTLILDFENSTNIRNFILTSKRNQAIGNPILYRSVLLGHIRDIQMFNFFARSIAREHALYVRAIELPDSFPISTTPLDTVDATSLLGRLPNLKTLTISASSISRNTAHVTSQTPDTVTTPAFSTFWTPAMFENVPFKLDQLVGAFTNPKVCAALFATQPVIRGWATKGGIPAQLFDWTTPSLKQICIDLSPHLQQSWMGNSIPLAELPFRSRIRKLVVRGTGGCGAPGVHGSSYFNEYDLASLENVTTLSVAMLKAPNMTQYEMLTRIMKSTPKLTRLTFWTFGIDAIAVGAERQRYMNSLEPFKSLSQIPSMPGLKAMLIVIQHGLMPKITLDAVASVMGRSPQLVNFDIISMGGRGQAYVRTPSGVCRSWRIIRKPCLQDDWL